MNFRSKLFNAPVVGRCVLITLFFFQLSYQVFGGIIFDGSPGTNAPPATLGGFPMIPFAPDNRPLGLNETIIPIGGTCPDAVSSNFFFHHVRIGQGWATWSHGYTGDVYFTSLASRVLILPAGTRAIYFYVEPNAFGNFNVIANANDGTTSGPILIDGNAGAKYIGFYTNSASCVLTSIQIVTPVAANGFAVGEFGIFLDKPNGALACDDDVQISLDGNCMATITPDVVLEGDYTQGCSAGDFIVEVRDWFTRELVDDNIMAPWPQLGASRVGHKYEVKVMDPASGNSCWGIIHIEDKLPPILKCPPSITSELTCADDLSPASLGTPYVHENCGPYTLTYVDRVVKGSCELEYDKIIYRTWTAIDQFGNKNTCTQTIYVGLGSLGEVTKPPHFDGLPGIDHRNMLLCDEKIDRNKDISAHYDKLLCVDDYLLDKEYYESYGLRRPKVLGWNCLDSGPYEGHPNPDPVYYPAHPYGCWPDNTFVQWLGTERPIISDCHHLNTTYTDTKIDLVNSDCDAGSVGCYKLLRRWTMVDWCTSQILEYNQIIKVVDNTGPQILYPDSVVVNMEIWRCFGRFDMPAPWVTDNCSNEVHYTVEVEYGTVLGDDKHGIIITDLPYGLISAYIIAEDCCGNITKKHLVLDVQDNTPPVAVCDRKTVVSITGNLSPGENTAKVFAETFDDGSYDNCSQHVFFKAIRMDELLGTPNGSHDDNSKTCNGINGDDHSRLKGNQVYFDDYVKFCCEDVGKSIMIVFRVFDVDPGKGPVNPDNLNPGNFLSGHFSDCMIEVEVQDKSIPTIVAPPDVVVNCNFWFDLKSLENIADPTFGKLVNDLAWRTKVVTKGIVCEAYCKANAITNYPGYVGGIPPHLQPAPNKACDYYTNLYDASHPDAEYELLWGYDGYIISACGAMPSIVVDDLRECGQGRILRHFVARGATGTFVRATQTIWIVDCDPFYINRENRCDTKDDINWPDCSGAGIHLEGCAANTSPDNPALGKPTIANNGDDNCALIAIEHFDEVFTIEPDACYKILRRWVVIDWCQYDPIRNPEKGRWEYVQVIKVSDHISPVVTNLVGPCEPAEKNKVTNLCMAHVELRPVAKDSCTATDWLFYEYYLDMNNDGSFEYHVGNMTKVQYERGEIAKYRNNPFADDANKTFVADGTYPIGTHRIKWYVEDGCGNIGKCDTTFEVKDCKDPTPYCLIGIISVPMPSTGCIDVWAKDLDRGSFDNCTPADKLKFYFDGDPTMPFKRICCSDFTREKQKDELILDLEVWVEDLEGNRDFCKTRVIIQDNQNICPDPVLTIVSITGLIKTNTGSGVSPATVDLYQNGSLSKTTVTAKDGSYTFIDMTKNDNYIVRPSRNDETANGVTTADIVKIQKHILNQEEITNPYLLIAADVNKSGSITASDIAELRKLILGISDRFSKSPSWTFVPSAYIFPNPTSPWSYPGEEFISTVSEISVVNFIGIKVGDLNNTAKANLEKVTTTRSNEVLHFTIDEQIVKTGEELNLTFSSTDFNKTTGFQFTLKYDAASLSFDHVESGNITINEENFGQPQLKNGIITASWNSEKVNSRNTNGDLFTLVFKVNKNGNTKNLFKLNSDITPAEAYSELGEIKNIELLIKNGHQLSEINSFELFQNTPNPFSKSTIIGFNLPNDAPVKLTIYDLTGKVLQIINQEGFKGINSISLDRSEILNPGIYYYQLDAQNHSDTKRMIILE